MVVPFPTTAPAPQVTPPDPVYIAMAAAEMRKQQKAPPNGK
jgi:hypothetical protein